ncbi:hypothetical protein [uncultured Sulfitobacter sp.]|uniref:calcium-binding protein n=1 Tax=uncultured Sulfitobacter sp. TaxID=191468 RepID=UPI00261ADF96|nr:hypothetical protein [uncultured Sulfitobacter sp.]
MYIISDNVEYTANKISADLFGLNFVLSYDMEFLEVGPLLNLLGSLQPENLRYPGGSITETMFSQVEYDGINWAEQYFSSMQNDITQRENMNSFVQSAGDIGASIQLVLPTSIAFEQSAGQAIAMGNYGDRRKIDPQYFILLGDYIEEFLATSVENDVEITRVELGNEFWGSGRMTASEYGYLAAEVTEYLAKHFPDLEVIAQVSYIAGFFSPVEDSIVYLSKNGSNFDTYFPWQDLANIPDLVEYTLPGQGSGVGQTQDIASQFRDNPIALNALDGIVDHLYFRKGFAGIDTERNHGLIAIPKTFEDTSGLEEIDTFITEWSVRNISKDRESEGTNHTGLQYAGSTLEAFFELAQHNVKGANFWPTTFGNESIDRRVLIDTSEQDLTFGGEIFRLMATNLIGLFPKFDFEVEGEIDIHGFSNTDTLVLFVNERSGEQSSPKIDLSDFAFDGSAFINVTYLSGDGETGTEINSNPIISELDGFVLDTNVIDLNLDPWSIAMINIQDITSSNDRLNGTALNDRIEADAGNDLIYGNAGDDRLYGQFGDDTIDGGAGDDSLYGGWGDDSILGGSGDDFLAGTFGNNTLDGGEGNDVIVASDGNNLLRSGAGADIVTLGSGADIVYAGDGNDEIGMSTKFKFWEDGFGAYNIGTEQFIPIQGFVQYSDVVYGGDDHDTLVLSEQQDAFFLDDDLSAFHSLIGIRNNDSEVSGVARFSGIEVIDAGAGNDIIDLTSERYQLNGEGLTISGGEGNDTIWGSNDDETISGGNGDDHLFGGAGADFLIGGAGSDIFEFSIFDSQDRISDFDYTDGDLIHIYGTSESVDLSLTWTTSLIEVTANFGSSVSYFSVELELAEMDLGVPITLDTLSDFIVFL